MPESLPAAHFDHPTLYASVYPKMPDSSGADLSLVRHLCRRLTHNLITMNRLPLCPKKGKISGLLRHPCIGPPTPSPTTHNPQPTSRTLRLPAPPMLE
jgi:hypothetical protein